MGEANFYYFTCLNRLRNFFELRVYLTKETLNKLNILGFSLSSFVSCEPCLNMSGNGNNGNYHGTNSQGNSYTSYGGDRGNYYYNNQDGGRYYNAGTNQGSFYSNADKGYQWYQNSSGDRSYKSHGSGGGNGGSGKGSGGRKN